VTPRNRLERIAGGVLDEPRRESMIGINQIRRASAQPRVAQPSSLETASII
jgi:hypothetical protein